MKHTYRHSECGCAREYICLNRVLTRLDSDSLALSFVDDHHKTLAWPMRELLQESRSHGHGHGIFIVKRMFTGT
jgi:hypothetical protein